MRYHAKKEAIVLRCTSAEASKRIWKSLIPEAPFFFIGMLKTVFLFAFLRLRYRRRLLKLTLSSYYAISGDINVRTLSAYVLFSLEENEGKANYAVRVYSSDYLAFLLPKEKEDSLKI